MKKKRFVIAATLAASSVCAAIVGTAGAVTTERFVLDDADSLAAGELIHTAVHSDGRVEAGVDLQRVALPADVPLVYSSVQGPDGAIYLGTGNDGRVFRVRGERVEVFAQTGQLLVASMVFGEGGTLYAGTLPEGRIYAIGANGNATELVRPEGAQHVWDLAWDGRRRLLFAATGPEGKVYAIDRQGRATVWWDSS